MLYKTLGASIGTSNLMKNAQGLVKNYAINT